MTQVYTTTYEIIGDGIPLADAWYQQVNAARAAQWAFVERVGARGFRPSSFGGGISSIIFEGELPAGWKQLRGKNMVKGEAWPSSSKAGLKIKRRIEELPCCPSVEELARDFGYSPTSMPIDSHRGTIHFPTEMQVSHPVQRSFLRIPRYAGDEFEPDGTRLRAIPESELMKAVEDHNAEAKRLREAEEAA